jgi:hypothetical protein
LDHAVEHLAPHADREEAQRFGRQLIDDTLTEMNRCHLYTNELRKANVAQASRLAALESELALVKQTRDAPERERFARPYPRWTPATLWQEVASLLRVKRLE